MLALSAFNRCELCILLANTSEQIQMQPLITTSHQKHNCLKQWKVGAHRAAYIVELFGAKAESHAIWAYHLKKDRGWSWRNPKK
mmetsp:Transcript_5999/g.10600  ORF Transcript_5999/g.10600 Transcript_5999/m.10600 type:complete len:84 (-) Transcript_5999:29-280(-)